MNARAAMNPTQNASTLPSVHSWKCYPRSCSENRKRFPEFREKIFSLSGATTAAYSSYDINTPSASADGSRKVVHEQATLQSQLFAQIDAWETRMQALGDKVLGYPEPSGTATVH